jgi:hypothetical protein
VPTRIFEKKKSFADKCGVNVFLFRMKRYSELKFSLIISYFGRYVFCGSRIALVPYFKRPHHVTRPTTSSADTESRWWHPGMLSSVSLPLAIHPIEIPQLHLHPPGMCLNALFEYGICELWIRDGWVWEEAIDRVIVSFKNNIVFVDHPCVWHILSIFALISSRGVRAEGGFGFGIRIWFVGSTELESVSAS